MLISKPCLGELIATEALGEGQKVRTAMHTFCLYERSFAIGHRTWKTGLPVRSVVLKPCAGRLVVGWVTTSEYLLLIVFGFFATKYGDTQRNQTSSRSASFSIFLAVPGRLHRDNSQLRFSQPISRDDHILSRIISISCHNKMPSKVAPFNAESVYRLRVWIVKSLVASHLHIMNFMIRLG
jgi:hypothetical protein